MKKSTKCITIGIIRFFCVSFKLPLKITFNSMNSEDNTMIKKRLKKRFCLIKIQK